MGEWKPPGKNCGACGAKNCDDFMRLIKEGKKTYTDCPFYSPEETKQAEHAAEYSEKDVVGKEFDFILDPLPGEVSARKIILPFRADLVEKMNIRKGDIVIGRPMGQGCPIQHVLEVLRADPISGVLDCWVVGPEFSRNRPESEVKDVKAYHVIGFEGIARKIKHEPVFGLRQRFLPGFCMMNLGHTGVVNTLLKKKEGLFVRVEDVRIF